MEMPKINFEPLLNYSEDSLLKKVWDNPLARCFLVYLRCKYAYQTKWEYLIECCCDTYPGGLLWFNDWYEGQDDVEYLGIAIIDVPQDTVLEV